MLDWIQNLNAERAFEVLAGLTAVLAVTFSMTSAIRSGVIRSIRLGSLEIEGGITEADILRIKNFPGDGAQPFEVTALSSYYNQALSRANISFWFSIVFASVGFGTIVFALYSHNSEDITGTIIKVASGTVIDAVSALFFVQSTNAQKSMSEFFEKLRLDRLNAEAREMISEIEDIERRDQLRAQLILKYSGIDRLLEGDKAK